MSRKILLHYHLFKNAGSSIDRLLSESYGDNWKNHDKSEPAARISAREIQAYLEARPNLKALSSHQIVPPLPVGNFEVFPIVFLRDPILRVKSAWLFEWKKQLGLDEPKGTLSEYIDEKLQPKRGSVIANFQVSRLGNSDYDKAPLESRGHENDELQRAIKFLRSIPFFGLVERFDDSLALLAREAASDFPELCYHHYQENVTQNPNIGKNEIFDDFRSEVGEQRFNQVLLRNRLDLQLYSYAQGLFDARCASAKISHSAQGEPWDGDAKLAFA